MLEDLPSKGHQKFSYLQSVFQCHTLKPKSWKMVCWYKGIETCIESMLGQGKSLLFFYPTIKYYLFNNVWSINLPKVDEA